MEKIEVKKAYIELLTPQIVLITSKEDTVLEVDDITEIKKINKKLISEKKYSVISDAQKYTSMSDEARKYLTDKKIEENKISHAYIIYSLAQRMIVNHFISFNKPKVPTKIFSNLEGAKNWTDEQLSQS